MSDEIVSPDQLDNSRMDYVASLTKGGLGAVPFVGSLLAEIAGTLIPQQRLDRLANFAKQLHARVEDIEGKVHAKLSDENFTDLVEEVMRQAGRSTSESRRSYLASLLANGIDSNDISAMESKHLARILGELNDAEVIWLIFYSTRQHADDQDFDEFMRTHDAILSPVGAHSASPISELDAETLQQSYKAHLSQLGLIQPKYAIDRKTKSPEFDRRGRQKLKGYESTRLGRMLVRQISDARTVEDAGESEIVD